MTIQEIFSTVIAMCGGLGLFLFGMKVMSNAIEKAAGAKLRHILEIFTTNRFSGIVVGLFFTAAIQSSSACTSMVVSFVNAGLMNLTQAAGVILGANIGTTVTSLLVSFNLSAYAPLILLVGVIITMFVKKEQAKQIGEIIVGFGILFIGLSGMKDAMSVLRTSETVINVIGSLRNPLFAILVGTAITALVQSSSVTVSIVLLLANTGIMAAPLPDGGTNYDGLAIIIYIIFGCNIGATATALISSLSGKKDAKRAALIHFWFNVIGTVICAVIMLFLKKPIINGLLAITPMMENDAGVMVKDLGKFVAYSHIIIKVFQVIIFLPFIKPLVKFSSWCVHGEDKKVGYREEGQLKYIGEKVVFNPATAVVEVIKELDRMASLASENLNRAMNALITLDQDDIDEVYRVEKNIDFLNHAITDYLVKINQTTLPIEDLKSIGGLFHVVNDIERIGDHAENIADAAFMRKENGAKISKEAQKELGEMLDMVNKSIQYAIEMFSKSDETHMQDIIKLEDMIDEKERELQHNHVERLTRGECTPEAGMIYSDVISGLERVGDHATNIAFAIIESDKAADNDEN